MEWQKPCISCSLLAVVKPGMMSPLVYRCSTQVTQRTERRTGDWFHEGQSWCSEEMWVGTRWALPTRKHPDVLPHVPPRRGGCLGLALHGAFHPIWLKVSRRHGPSVGKSATNSQWEFQSAAPMWGWWYRRQEWDQPWQPWPCWDAASAPMCTCAGCLSSVSPLTCKQAVTDQHRGCIFSVLEAVS